ncbi:ATP-dependent helicase HrpB [Mangrovibacterium lignilyticum]|uniref:ATP-dependent helicase HrpB n=1 Tax=Mangrovibacterium lignilyticum TaxID=2668052 RepID=UPI001EE50B79|nr:ATP-dependent helicase HrpB [Mangrovibacterium lignilyticum]
MTFNIHDIDLPVVAILEEIREKLRQTNTLIITAPPGAGKSTLVPLDLLKLDELAGQKIIMLEPRRLAARSIAERMASLLGEDVGETVGYRIRFENRVSAKTKIEVVTEGILTRMLHADNSLEGVSMVVFDEFHERSIHADVALALCREAQQILRPDLRIVVMSATLNLPLLSEILQAPVIQSEGRQFPVDVIYSGESDLRMLAELAAQNVMRALREQEGDVLVFLPGEGEIRTCESLLKREKLDLEIHPLYGMLPKSKQLAAIFPSRRGNRKVILATSIAETSLTIEGVQVVVDCGYARTARFDPKSGLSRLETIRISKDSADQRAGRAGRLGPGTCYRMWTKANQEQLAEHRIPEIMEADLADLVLDLAQWGIMDPNQLSWLSPPPRGAVAQASELLHQLDALEQGKITDLGRELHRLPCHPRIAHMLVMARENGQMELATDLAAVLEERDPLGKEAGIDINLRIEALRKQRGENRLSNKMKRIEKIAESYRKIIGCKPNNEPVNPFETGLLLVFAYPERIAFARPGNNAPFQLSNGSMARAGHQDDLAHEPWLAVAHLNARDGMGTIFLASPLDPTDLAPLVKNREVISWDSKKGGVVANSELRIGSIVLQTKPLPNPDKSHLQKAISEAVKKDGEHLLNFNEEVTQWQNRVMSIRKWLPDGDWPDVSTTALLQSNEQWLSPYLEGVRKADDLKKIDLTNVLHYHLTPEQQQTLDRHAPARVKVPSGSSVKLSYQSNGAPPVLAVRLQEVFGLADTPSVNNGKINVLMHLLSPGYKPVQVTSDLRSFWNNTYFEVKKELKRRYPKHAWPEDPWTEEAIRGVKRKKND